MILSVKNHVFLRLYCISKRCYGGHWNRIMIGKLVINVSSSSYYNFHLFKSCTIERIDLFLIMTQIFPNLYPPLSLMNSTKVSKLIWTYSALLCIYYQHVQKWLREMKTRCYPLERNLHSTFLLCIDSTNIFLNS